MPGWLLVALLGCADRVPTPGRAPNDDPTADWVRLASQVGSSGGVDFERLAKGASTVQATVAWAAVHGTEANLLKESWEDQRLSELINAHNANMAYVLLEAGSPAHLDALPVPAFASRLLSGPASHPAFAGAEVRVDLEWITLRRLRIERLLARFQEPLVHAALWLGVRGGPALRGWRKKGLQRQLEDAMSRFIASDRGMRPDGDGYAAHGLFTEFSDHFTVWGEQPTVCAWMAPYATGERGAWLKDHAADCPLGVIPPDWSVDRRAGDAAPDVAPPEDTGGPDGAAQDSR